MLDVVDRGVLSEDVVKVQAKLQTHACVCALCVCVCGYVCARSSNGIVTVRASQRSYVGGVAQQQAPLSLHVWCTHLC